MRIKEILEAKKEAVNTVSRNEVLGKRQFNGNYSAAKVKKANKEIEEITV